MELEGVYSPDQRQITTEKPLGEPRVRAAGSVGGHLCQSAGRRSALGPTSARPAGGGTGRASHYSTMPVPRCGFSRARDIGAESSNGGFVHGDFLLKSF
jgi:hypothetical protein